jgi:protein-disulfide isomerase
VIDKRAPFSGPADAPLTIVEFSDCHCPYCKQVLSTLTQVLSRYSESVKLVFRDFPVDGHPLAWRAAQAARCPKDRDKFWQFHDPLFPSRRRLAPTQLRELAQQVGADVPIF